MSSFRIFRLARLGLLACLSLGAGSAIAHEHPVGAALGASAAFDAQGGLWVVTSEHDHVLLRHSRDFGQRFSNPVQVNPVGERIYARGENRPKIAVNDTGEIYVQWTRQVTEGWTGEIRFARSDDGGRHFSAPLTVHHDHSVVTRGFDSLAVSDDGAIVSLWIDARDTDAAHKKDEDYAGFALYSAWSSDGGRSFAPERKLVDHSCECCATRLLAAGPSRATAFFRSVYPDNIRDHTLATLSPDPDHESRGRATFSQWQIEACPDHGPGLALGADGQVHGVWYEASDGPRLWYGQLHADQPPEHTLALAGAGAGHPDVISTGSQVYVVWNQIDAEGFQLLLRQSDDAGEHFQPARVLATSSVAVDSPQLLMHAGHVFVGWNTAEGYRVVTVTAP